MLPFPMNIQSMTESLPGTTTLVVYGLCCGFVGAEIHDYMQPARPDPFTGRQGLQLEAELSSDINRVQSELNKHLQYSLDKTSNYDAAIARLEVLYDMMSATED